MTDFDGPLTKSFEHVVRDKTTQPLTKYIKLALQVIVNMMQSEMHKIQGPTSTVLQLFPGNLVISYSFKISVFFIAICFLNVDITEIGSLSIMNFFYNLVYQSNYLN